MTTVPFATGPGDLDSQFLPMKSFAGKLNQVVPHLSEEQKYVDVHFIDVTIIEMESGQVMWPHPTLTINIPYYLGRNQKPLAVSSWGKFISSVTNAGTSDVMSLIGSRVEMAAVFEKYTDRSGNERKNQIWEIQALAGAVSTDQMVLEGDIVEDLDTEAQDRQLLEMIDGATHADFAQKVLNSGLRADQKLVNELMDQTLVARLIAQGKVVEENERYRLVTQE